MERLAGWYTRAVKRIAWWLRCLADRIDHAGAPKATHHTFTFERGKGILFREDGRGCAVWYYGDADYEKAHTDSDTAKADAERREALQRVFASMTVSMEQAGRNLNAALKPIAEALAPYQMPPS